MTQTRSDRPPLRLWPGLAIVALQWLMRFGLPDSVPNSAVVGALGGVFSGPAILVWWAFFSRASRAERWGGAALMIVAVFGTKRLLDESLATAGMGFLYFMYVVPILCLAFVGWAFATRRLSDKTRRWSMVATILIVCGAWALLRTEGVDGDSKPQFAWRWSPTAEERLLARAGDEPAAPAFRAVDPHAEADWPGFRGRDRNSVIAGVRIETDWSTSPPVELWRRLVGPGWSSFAVRGDLLYTQEQRGEQEIVACYDTTTGRPVWRHRDTARFWESQGGAGPRGTPTLHAGQVYTLGATGIVNALDAAEGTVVWSRDAVSDSGAKIPYWGVSASPLVVDDMVVVAASSTLVAYELATGQPRWIGPAGSTSYSSPHHATIDGVEQIMLLNGRGVASLAPTDGALLWEHDWPGSEIVQPALMPDGDLLIAALSMNGGAGIRRIGVGKGSGGWTVEERWTSNRLKPYFNDFVVHQGHAYGFDGGILACIDVETGERRWKGGRYGHGQLVLLADQAVLLVLSERGGLALVSATPDGFEELASVSAIEGKTWNHPVLIGDLLLVRNDREMAAFRLALAGT